MQNVQAGHKYLFSDVTHTWADAVLESQMYGGWLISAYTDILSMHNNHFVRSTSGVWWSRTAS